MALKSRAQRLLLAYLLYEVSKPRVSTRKFEDLQRKLKYAGMTGGASPYTLETHGNTYHSPNFEEEGLSLLLDGTRAMTDDLNMYDGTNHSIDFQDCCFHRYAGTTISVMNLAKTAYENFRCDQLLSTSLSSGGTTFVMRTLWSAGTGMYKFQHYDGGWVDDAKFANDTKCFEIFRAGDITMLANKTFTFSVGTKHDGLIIKPAAEVQTTDATQTTVDSLTLLDENTYHVEAEVVGVKSDGSQRASYHLACTAYRTGAGNATLQGAVTSLHTQESDANWDATFTVNGNDLRVSVTGVAATTVEWGCTMLYLNMSN